MRLRAGLVGREGLHVRGGQRIATDRPFSAFDFLHPHPGDGAHVLAFDCEHGVGHFFDHESLLVWGENAFDELDVDEWHVRLLVAWMSRDWLRFGAIPKAGRRLYFRN